MVVGQFDDSEQSCQASLYGAATSNELLMLVLLGSAIACYIAALSIRTLRRSAARGFLGLAAVLITATWLNETLSLDPNVRYAVGVVILIGLGIFAAFVKLPSLNPDKIQVCLAHSTGKHYKGATPAEHLQVLTHDHPIQIEYLKREKVHLCFGIDKGIENDGMPLTNMRLWLSLNEDSGIRVEVQKTQDGNLYHEWKHYRDTDYFYDFERPMNQTKTNTWNCLYLTFPEAHDYELKFTITAEGIPAVIRSASVRVHPKAQ